MNEIHDEAGVDEDVANSISNDRFAKRLAKGAFQLVFNDFRRYTESKGLNAEEKKMADLFGYVSISETKKFFFDSLIWVFELHEEEPRLPFSYACEVLGRDSRSFQQCTANALHSELIELIAEIRVTCGEDSAWRAADKLSEFVSVDRKIK